MTALRFAIPALAAALAACTFNPDGTVTRTDTPPPELMPYKVAPRPDGPAPTLLPRKSTEPEGPAPGPVLASATAVPAQKSTATASPPAPVPAKPKIAACCVALPQAVAMSAAEAGATVPLSATTPHFDFGRGVAPFAVYALPAGTRSVQIYAPMQRTAMLDGGTGTTRYADTAPLFLDANNNKLDAKQLDAGQRWWGASARAYFRSFEVPAGSTRLVVATDPNTDGRTGVSMIYGTPTMPLVASDYQEFRVNGLTFNSYETTMYGPVVVQINR